MTVLLENFLEGVHSLNAWLSFHMIMHIKLNVQKMILVSKKKQVLFAQLLSHVTSHTYRDFFVAVEHMLR